MVADESHSASLQGSVRRAKSAGMFALSTNNNHPQIPTVMNQFSSSFFAAVFTLAASTAFANTDAVVAAESAAFDHTVVTVELAAENAVTMRVMATLPNGEKASVNKTTANMAMALIAYQNFIMSLPLGSKIDRVEFTDQGGNTLFSSGG